MEALPALQIIETPAALPRDFLKERRLLEAELKEELRRNQQHWQSWTWLQHRLRRGIDG